MAPTSVASITAAPGRRRRLKKDVKKVGKLDGHSLYEYRYKDEPQRGAKYIGVMAQEVEKTRPDVISRDPDGMRRVDYGRLFSAVRRIHPLVATVGTALGLNDSQIDAMWLAAVNL